MNIQTPKGWRKGQTIFNFLEFINNKNGIDLSGRLEDTNSVRMADPFHIPDKTFDKLFEEFLDLHR